MNLTTLLRLVASSIFLDMMMLRNIQTTTAMVFLLQKYALIIVPWMYKDDATNAYTLRLLGKQVFLPTPLDIRAIQSNFIAHSYLTSYIPKNSTIIDVGAHIGQFNIFCTSYLHATSVLSFEPVQSSYDFLKLNAVTKTYHKAISPKKSLLMNVPAYTQLSTIFPVTSHHHKETVSCISIDDLLEIQQLERIDLLKIDVEGMEHSVLETCAKTLQKTHYLLIELSLERHQSTSSLETLSYIRTLVPQAQLIRVCNIYPDSNHLKQEVVDMLFRITNT